MSRNYRPRARVPVRRGTSWVGGAGTGAAFDNTSFGSEQTIHASGRVAATGAMSSGFDGQTIVRIRGVLRLRLSTVTAGGDGYAGAIGMCVVSSDALAIGVTAVPDPFLGANEDCWKWHRFISLYGTETTPSDGYGGVQDIEIDSKAMRKFDEGQSLVMVSRWVEVGTAVIGWSAMTRVLLKVS